jgi:hypothetical protein
MKWIFIIFAFIGTIIFIRRINSNKPILKQIGHRKGGKITTSWKWGFLPVLKFPIGTDKAFFYFTPGKKCCLWVESEDQKGYADLYICESSITLTKKVGTGNQDFDSIFTVTHHAHGKLDKGLIFNTVSSKLQNKLIELKEEVCKKIVNQFIELSHLKNSDTISIQVKNFSFPKNDKIERLTVILNKMIEVYQAYKESGSKTTA